MINRDEWLAALQAAQQPIPESDAVSAAEFAAAFELSHGHAARRLKDLVAAGQAQFTKKQVRRADGGTIWVPAYRLTPQKSKRSK